MTETQVLKKITDAGPIRLQDIDIVTEHADADAYGIYLYKLQGYINGFVEEGKVVCAFIKAGESCKWGLTNG